MTIQLVGLTYTGALILSELRRICKVRCACGQEFHKAHEKIVRLRAKGFMLRCWRCLRQAARERAMQQAGARPLPGSSPTHQREPP